MIPSFLIQIIDELPAAVDFAKIVKGVAPKVAVAETVVFESQVPLDATMAAINFALN